jgi:hypothetical protein
LGSTHFLTRTLKRVRTEMSLHVLAYNMKRVIAIIGIAAAGDPGLSAWITSEPLQQPDCEGRPVVLCQTSFFHGLGRTSPFRGVGREGPESALSCLFPLYPQSFRNLLGGITSAAALRPPAAAAHGLAP